MTTTIDMEDEMRKYEIKCPLRHSDELCKVVTKVEFGGECEEPLGFLACPYYQGVITCLSEIRKFERGRWN
jgi:hypothetical protein